MTAAARGYAGVWYDDDGSPRADVCAIDLTRMPAIDDSLCSVCREAVEAGLFGETAYAKRIREENERYARAAAKCRCSKNGEELTGRGAHVVGCPMTEGGK